MSPAEEPAFNPIEHAMQIVQFYNKVWGFAENDVKRRLHTNTDNILYIIMRSIEYKYTIFF